MENQLLQACAESSVVIMGMSFVIGSLFTIFVLVILDMYRAWNANKGAAKE